MLNLSTEQINQTPLTEEEFKEVVNGVMTKAYRKGFNDGLDAVVQLIVSVNRNTDVQPMKDLMHAITKSVLGLKLEEENVYGKQCDGQESNC